MSKLIITSMPVRDRQYTVCALQEDGQITELRLESANEKKILGSVFVGKAETISQNINAAFILLGNGVRAYFPLEEEEHLIYASGSKKGNRLKPGDEVLVQVSRDAMKGKLPAVTANISLTGRYLVLTTANKKTGFSTKLSDLNRARLSDWLSGEFSGQGERAYGLIVRTNAAEASQSELSGELDTLKSLYERVVLYGRNRTCFSCLYEPPAFYLTMLRDLYSEDLEEIITDQPEILDDVLLHLRQTDESQCGKVRLYQDHLLPLYKLYSLEQAVKEICSEKVWLKSGGFLVIQQTEAFVSIDVNSGKHVSRKKAEETFRTINLEASKEIVRQLRLRNLSGIILIDFINMENQDHREELFHVLKNLVKKDSVKCSVIDITPLHILEMTRKKIRRPVIEDLDGSGS